MFYFLGPDATVVVVALAQVDFNLLHFFFIFSFTFYRHSGVTCCQSAAAIKS